MKVFFTALAFFVCTSFLVAQQSYVHQVIFLNEGWFDFFNDTLVVPPSVGSYDPLTQSYSVFDQIPEADFATDVIIDDVIYVAADNYLITYDKDLLTRLQTKTIPGIRSMAVWKDQLIISRGDYQVFFDSYVQIYDRHTLELIYELNTTEGPEYASEGIVVRDDIAYIAISNGFVFGEEVGFIGILDLNTRTYVGEIDLGPSGINPDNIMVDDDRIYTLNNKDYTSSSISSIEPATQEVTTYDNIAANSGCGTSALANNHIYYMEYGVDKLARFDIETAQIVDTLPVTEAYYGLIDDKLNQKLIATWTDFVSTGIASILTYDGTVVHAFEVGVSPGSIALDVRTSTGIHAVYDEDVKVFPNPASDYLTITSEKAIAKIEILDPLGRVMYRETPLSSETTLNLASWSSGMYLTRIQLASGEERTYRVIHK